MHIDFAINVIQTAKYQKYMHFILNWLMKTPSMMRIIVAWIDDDGFDDEARRWYVQTGVIALLNSVWYSEHGQCVYGSRIQTSTTRQDKWCHFNRLWG